MELHSLKPAEGAVQRNVKRVGRGQGSGKGATSGRGHKGDGSRSGSKTKRGFEGGQMPLQRRLPKRGFKNPFRVEYVPVNLIRLQELADEKNITILDFETLCKLGVSSKNAKLKILADGEITAKLTVTAHAFSAAAKEAIEKAGGTATQI